ncbi:DNA-directed RNA polymerase III subunit RPC3 [Camellia lanceoleosa]|uniref:DNA-directed RNA polymerase III subunit RPC3 n=1 Tax=Camellia lanceoleosa TaxID=1840588 RepID=A0ACC0H742_9ERIC|nr:DNA-directed RNA polymerase III subunit RPC3 [Camellia lanceoleosa]
MVTQYGIKLSVSLISSYFGNLVAKVCECLLRRGTLSCANIVRFTELNKVQVRNSLLVLIQHNCVQAFSIQQEGSFGEAPKVVTQYMVLFDNIIHHMRFPKFLAYVSEELGKECEDILEGLLQHAEEETVVKKQGAKSAKVMKESETIEQRALAAAAPMEALRFLVETYTETDCCGEESEGNPLPSATVGEKRKQSDLELDTEAGTKKRRKEVLYANFEEFVRCLRDKGCIGNVRTRLDDGAAIVLSAILKATRSAENKVKIENSVPLSMDTIFEEVMKSEEGRSMTLERARASLVQLGCHLPEIGIDETYSIDLKSIIELAQNEEVESIVLKRYGREAYRIFRLLSKAGHLVETDKISNTTFVAKKDTAKILYTLWKDDYLHMEKIVTYGSKQSQFLLWKVNKHTLWDNVLNEMYHTALNLRIRIAHEQEQEKEILRIPREKLVGELAKRYARLRKVRIVLESSLMKLDDAIMLFHDF